VKLVLDENLSPKLVRLLEPVFPDVEHIFSLGWISWDDKAIWDGCRLMNAALITKDNDFIDLATLYGRPPFVVKLAIGNQPTRSAAAILVRDRDLLEAAFQRQEQSTLILHPVRLFT
jgi:predicted nuclease of predicted toxin-antitoxin system